MCSIDGFRAFFALRTWAQMADGALKTEMVYPHTKCMVVDDRAAIIGSANINDRSLLGTRDSEVCLVIQDSEMVGATMGGERALVGRFASQLRCEMMAAALGVAPPAPLPAGATEVDASDPRSL